MEIQFGRLILVGSSQTYVVAREDKAEAICLVKSLVADEVTVEAIGRASKELLNALGLKVGQYKVADTRDV